jgi:hypothetical protein
MRHELERDLRSARLRLRALKHFVRLRVRRDGSRLDAWVLGKVDTARVGEPVVLVDKFHWDNPAYAKASGSRE